MAGFMVNKSLIIKYSMRAAGVFSFFSLIGIVTGRMHDDVAGLIFADVLMLAVWALDEIRWASEKIGIGGDE